MAGWAREVLRVPVMLRRIGGWVWARLRGLGPGVRRWVRANPRMAALLVAGLVAVGLAYRYRLERQADRQAYPDTRLGRRLGRARTHEERLRIVREEGRRKQARKHREREKMAARGAADAEMLRDLGREAAAEGDYERCVRLFQESLPPYQPLGGGPKLSDYIGHISEWDDYVRERREHKERERRNREEWFDREWWQLMMQRARPGESDSADAAMALCLHYRSASRQGAHADAVRGMIAHVGASSKHGRRAGLAEAQKLLSEANAASAASTNIEELACAEKQQATALRLVAAYQDGARADALKRRAEQLEQHAERAYFEPERVRGLKQRVADAQKEKQQATTEEERAKASLDLAEAYVRLGREDAAAHEWLAVAHTAPPAQAEEAIRELLDETPKRVSWEQATAAIEQALARGARAAQGSYPGSLHQLSRFAGRAAEAGRPDIEGRVALAAAYGPTPPTQGTAQQNLALGAARSCLEAGDDAAARRVAERYVELRKGEGTLTAEDVLAAVLAVKEPARATQYDVHREAERRRMREADGLPPMMLPATARG
jgi:hypothetical protein